LLQVPIIPPSNAVHQNGVLGVAHLLYITPASILQAFASQLKSVYGSEPIHRTDEDNNEILVWTLQAPSAIEKGHGAWGEKLSTEVHLRAASGSEDEAKRGSGLWEVAFWVDGQSGQAKSKWGKIKFINSGRK
jgi:hypothetical protein